MLCRLVPRGVEGHLAVGGGDEKRRRARALGRQIAHRKLGVVAQLGNDERRDGKAGNPQRKWRT